MNRSSFLILLMLGVLAGIQQKVCSAQDEQSSARKVINKVVPIYPELARAIKLSGAVKVEVLVQPNGSVKLIQVKGGNPLLAQSAQSAVHGWMWEKADHETTELV